jgi:hypothetical protein
VRSHLPTYLAPPPDLPGTVTPSSDPLPARCGSMPPPFRSSAARQQQFDDIAAEPVLARQELTVKGHRTVEPCLRSCFPLLI